MNDAPYTPKTPTTRIEARFTDVAEAFPRRIALTDPEGDTLYGELLAGARAVAHALRGLGVTPGDAVLLVGHGGRDTVLGMLGVLLAGGCYVPVDPGYPAERVRTMAERARAVLTLHVGETSPGGLRIPGFEPRALADAAPAPGPVDVPPAPCGPDDLAYIMFTSGTTGEPKPVGVTHRGVVSLALDQELLKLSPEDGVLLHSTLAFDASTYEIWAPLLAGARITAAGRHPLALHELAALLSAPEVTTAWLTAPLFPLMAHHHGAALGTLRTLITGGDTVPAGAAADFHTAYPATRLINGYGPTENTTFSTLGPASAWQSPRRTAFPIGTPLRGTSCYILDERLAPVPPGTAGELFLGGDRLARGYLGLPAATAERFLPDPFASGPGARMYRTGDRVRQLPDGALDFRGRTDEETKVRGHRVHPAEASAILAADPAVHGAAVLAHPGPDGTVLAGFVTPAALDTAALRARARQRAPGHLVADRITALDALPLAANGKVDRDALRALLAAAPAPDTPGADGATNAPTVGEPALAEAWEAHAGLPAGPDADFFAGGGTSIGLMRLVEEVRTRLGVTLDFASVYADPTFAGLTGQLRALRAAAAPAPGEAASQETVRTRADQPTGTSLERIDGLWIRVVAAPSQESVDRDFTEVDTWLREYVGRAHPELGRTGPVCPFVPPALNGKTAQFSLRYDTDGRSPNELGTLLKAEMADFAIVTDARPTTGAPLECRVVVLPGTGSEGWRNLDKMYPGLKSAAVADGLMISQFHPHCDERAVRNSAFPVSVAPLGMFAIRRMAPHDVLFLHTDHVWMETYDRLFRAHYERGRIRDPLLRKLYLAALDRHGLGPLTLTTKENATP